MAYWRLLGRRPRDVFLCSYPKSGRTWLRFLLTYYQIRLTRLDYPLTLKSFPALSPNLTLFSEFRLRNPPAGARLSRLIGTHSELPGLFRGSKILYLRRDLRDVLVSYYYHRRARGEIGDGLEAFLDSPWGVRHAVRYCNRWARGLARYPEDRVLRLSYERLHADTRGSVRQCLSFLELEIRDDLVEEAIDYAAASHMRRLEARWGTPDFSVEDLERDQTAFQVREARVGGHRRELPAGAAERVGAELRERLIDPGGYDY